MPLSWNEIRLRAAAFSNDWIEKACDAREEADAQTFQTDFLNVFGVTRRQVATFESRVKIGGQADLFGETTGGRRGYIDLFWKGHIMIEMKTPGKDLKKAYVQAREYAENLPPADLPAGILICDFVNFEYYNLEKDGEKTVFTLKDLPRYVELFGYLAGYRDTVFEAASPVDIEAAERMGDLHDALKETGYEGHDLEVYLVRLLFCLFADDTGIFEPKKLFFRYIQERTSEDGSDLALHLERIFDTLNREISKRSKAIDEQLNTFPWVDGGLFEERLAPADFTSKMRRTLLECCVLDWGQIKPEIFGSMFQEVMDAEKRRAMGEHYTSEQNILKIIRPLFLDSLQAEFARIKQMRSGEKKHRLLAFHDKLCRLKFLDPACGCGNFLIISYRELRRLEIETIKEYLKGEKILDIELMIRVNVNQFYGIEIEEFPVQIARTAMWLMDHLMNNEASAAFGKYIVRIPLTTAAKIVHANAIPLDWETVVPKAEVSYILGNPPFVGKKEQSERQKADITYIYHGMKGQGVLDYVICWYNKAAEYIKDTPIEAAFVSTNSICQGEQVPVLWPRLLHGYGLKINFAHQTFKWWNEARNRAAVHCVIIGFSQIERKDKVIFHYASVTSSPVETPVNFINAYLIDGPEVIISARSEPICDVPKMNYGSIPYDEGALILSEDEALRFMAQEPITKEMIRPYYGGEEFINNKKRFCLWLPDIEPDKIKKSKLVRERIDRTREFRNTSKREATNKLAFTPALFGEIRQPKGEYLLIPKVSSENRRYIPIGFMDRHNITNGSALIVPDASLYEFGMLTSGMHMAWMRYVCGRLEMRYQYSVSLVYNNFPWPNPTAKQKEAVGKNAQAVLDARAKYPESSLAVLYDPDTMPPVLVKAHQKLDKSVETAYGKTFTNDADRVAHLFYLYQTLTEGLLARKVRRKNI